MAAGDSTPVLMDHDGFVEAFFHLLWAKNFNGEPCPEVLVPDTIIYKYRIPAYWYFTGSDGRLRRKNKANIINQKIYKDFSAGARSDRDVVACHICERPLDPGAVDSDEPPARTETVVRYFDRASLKDFLFSQEKTEDGCLQKFVKPKGLFNSMIQAAWSPQMCLLERRVNLSPLLTGRAPLQERTATYEGSEHLSRITPVRGTLLADRIQHLCAEMVTHIAATSKMHQRIGRMLLNFKTDEDDHVWLLWCSSTCPFTERPLGEGPPYFVTYKAILDYNHLLDIRAHLKRPWGEVPPLLARVCPELDGEAFAKERQNPLSLFLYTRVQVSEPAYLEISSTALPGLRVMPALSGRARQKLLLAPSASAPQLPKLRKGSGSGLGGLGGGRHNASAAQLRGAPLPL